MRLLSRGIYTGIISPPTTYTINQSANYHGLFYPSPAVVNMSANAIVKSIGLFSNFADGLVFASNAQPLILNLSILGFSYVGATLPGTASSIAGFDGMLGVGTDYTVSLVSGDYIRGLTSGYIYRVRSITDNLNLVLYGCYPQAFSGERFEKLSVLGTLLPQGIVQIDTLNEMYPITLPSMQTLYAGNSAIKSFTLEMSLDIEAVSGMSFLTKSIDVSYAGSVITFDGAIDFEFTPA